MDFWTVVYACMTLIASLLLLAEVRAWLSRRGDPANSGPATFRLYRRGSGIVLLLVVLALLRFSIFGVEEPFWRLLQMLACLGFCLIVFLIAIWDFVVVRRELKQEFDGYTAEAAGDFRRHIEDLAEDNPELAEKLTTVLSQPLREPDESPSPNGENTQGAS